jgi:hypothetical protein
MALPQPTFQQKFGELFSEAGLSRYQGNEMSNDKHLSNDFDMIYKDYSMENLSIFNTEILPTVETDRIDHSWWWLRYDKVNVGKNPIGGTANKITYSVEERRKSSERWGNAVEISLMELLTPDGRERGLRSIQRLVSSFVESTAMKACLALDEPEPSADIKAYTSAPVESDDQLLAIINTEKDETFCSVKSETELFALIERKKARFALINANTNPDTVLMNAAKFGLLKYGNPRVNESYRNGPSSDGILFSASNYGDINGMKVVGIPMFPTDQESNHMTLLSKKFVTGSVMIYEETPMDFKDSVHVNIPNRVINIYSQQADGPVTITLLEIIDNLSCWGKDGKLDSNVYTLGVCGKDDVFYNNKTRKFVENFEDFDEDKVADGFMEGAAYTKYKVEAFDKPNLKAFVQAGGMLPFKILLMKPYQMYETSPLIILKKGIELGRTVISFNKETSGINAKTEQLYVQCNRFIAAIITDPFKRFITRNVFIERALSGTGSKFVTQPIWDDFKINGKNPKNFSLMTAIVPYHHNRLDTETGWIDMLGKFKKLNHAEEWVGSQAFTAKYQLGTVKQQQVLPPLECVRRPGAKRYPNRLLWWGAQTMGKMAENGAFAVNNRGPTGSICSRGDKAALDNGNQLKVCH